MTALKGPANPAWKGGRIVDGGGYIRVLIKGRYRPEHVVIAEKAFGRPLPDKHPVHHHDENRQNNAHTNLVICESKGYHNLIHARMDCLRDNVDPDSEKRCTLCREIKPLTEFHKGKSSIGKMSQCKSCWSKLSSKRKRMKIERACQECGTIRLIQYGSPRTPYCHSCSVRLGRLDAR